MLFHLRIFPTSSRDLETNDRYNFLHSLLLLSNYDDIRLLDELGVDSRDSSRNGEINCWDALMGLRGCFGQVARGGSEINNMLSELSY
eukprot:751738-Hanusia_phi.AAC.5